MNTDEQLPAVVLTISGDLADVDMQVKENLSMPEIERLFEKLVRAVMELAVRFDEMADTSPNEYM